MRFRGRPGQRVIDVARVHQLADELTVLRRPGQGRQQREQLAPVAGPGVFRECPAQRQMRGPGPRGDFAHVGRDKGKGIVRIAPVLRQMQADPADHVPDRILRLEITLNAALGRSRPVGQCYADIQPQGMKELRRDRLRARHGRRGLDGGSDLQRIRVGDGHGRGVRGVEGAANTDHQGAPEVAPIPQRRMQLGARQGRAQVQHAVPAPDLESIENTPRRRRWDPRSVLGGSGVHIDTPARRQSTDEGVVGPRGIIEGKACHGEPCCRCAPCGTLAVDDTLYSSQHR